MLATASILRMNSSVYGLAPEGIATPEKQMRKQANERRTRPRKAAL